MARTFLAMALSVAMALGMVGEARAHEGELPRDAPTLVRQAVALLQASPPQAGEAAERLEVALEPGVSGVRDRDLLEEALALARKRDAGAAAALLQRWLSSPAAPPEPRPATGGGLLLAIAAGYVLAAAG